MLPIEQTLEKNKNLETALRGILISKRPPDEMLCSVERYQRGETSPGAESSGLLVEKRSTAGRFCFEIRLALCYTGTNAGRTACKNVAGYLPSDGAGHLYVEAPLQTGTFHLELDGGEASVLGLHVETSSAIRVERLRVSDRTPGRAGLGGMFQRQCAPCAGGRGRRL